MLKNKRKVDYFILDLFATEGTEAQNCCMLVTENKKHGVHRGTELLNAGY